MSSAVRVILKMIDCLIHVHRAFGMNRMIGILFAAALVTPAAEASEERFALQLASGTEVQVRLLRASASSVRLPAIVVLGGLQRGSGVVDLIPRTTEAVVVGFDYPVALPERVAWTEALPVARRLERGIDETIECVGRLHSLLARRADIDPARLSIVGVSLGAPVAVIGAVQHDYRSVVFIDGFGDLPRTLRHQFARQAWQDCRCSSPARPRYRGCASVLPQSPCIARPSVAKQSDAGRPCSESPSAVATAPGASDLEKRRSPDLQVP